MRVALIMCPTSYSPPYWRIEKKDYLGCFGSDSGRSSMYWM